jgi:cell division protein FtsB
MKSLWGQGSKYLRVKRKNLDISPRVARILLIVILVLIGVIFLAGDVGLWNLWTAQKRMKSLEQKITELERENMLLKTEIDMLRSDHFAVEKIAREKYGYIRPGEKVYRIITLPKDEKSDRAAPSYLDMQSGNP